MNKLIITYKTLVNQLTKNVGDERSGSELMWNEGALEILKETL